MTENGQVSIVTLNIELLVDTIVERLMAHLEEQITEVEQGTPWLTLQQAADRLHSSYDWVYTHLHEIPHRRFAHKGKILIHRDELDAWTRRYMR